MNKNDFINNNLEYIGSLENAGVIYTADGWKDIIQAECRDYEQGLADHEISWIIEELEADGFVAEDFSGDAEKNVSYILETGMYEEAVNLMDDALREEMHQEGKWNTEKEFLMEYARRHAAKYGEAFQI